MSEAVLIGCGFMIGAAAALGWMWWSVSDAMDEYDDWNDYQ